MATTAGLPTARWRPSRPAAAGIGLVAALVVLIGLEAADVVMRGPDSVVLNWMLAHRSGGLTSLAVAVTDSGTSPVLFPLVAAAGVLVYLRTERWAPGLAALAVVVVGVLSRLGLATLVGDARPPSADRLVAVSGFSFPSGHAATSALVAGTLAWLLSLLLPGRPARVVIAAALGSWAVLVGLSRVYLGVHWVSDVLGSWLLAGAWLALLVAVGLRLARPTSPA
ncbi:MAG TPA: phosphatase PAP2 family protein [Mycobacteriales bacterium]|jgi:undecaprenyl-diphosphatase|nr:phosphatase PAP2 family protein [Mycobacteriales bacterium]